MHLDLTWLHPTILWRTQHKQPRVTSTIRYYKIPLGSSNSRSAKRRRSGHDRSYPHKHRPIETFIYVPFYSEILLWQVLIYENPDLMKKNSIPHWKILFVYRILNRTNSEIHDVTKTSDGPMAFVKARCYCSWTIITTVHQHYTQQVKVLWANDVEPKLTRGRLEVIRCETLDHNDLTPTRLNFWEIKIPKHHKMLS